MDPAAGSGASSRPPPPPPEELGMSSGAAAAAAKEEEEACGLRPVSELRSHALAFLEGIGLGGIASAAAAAEEAGRGGLGDLRVGVLESSEGAAKSENEVPSLPTAGALLQSEACGSQPDAELRGRALEFLQGIYLRGGASAAAEACGSRPAGGLRDVRVGILESSEGATKCQDKMSSLPQAGALLRSEAACLTLGRASDAAPVKNRHNSNPLACGKENIRTDLQSKPDMEHDENKMNARQHALDLNIVGSSDAAELNPFFPYKKLGQSKVSDPSECGSTTGATGESESHKKWREMKQNGFLSSSHGTAVVPKPRGRPSKRKRDDESKRSISTQNEQTNKFMKVAAPSGLLSGLNPGIINHVRNSKQVYSIIKAMVHSEELENERQPVFTSQTGERGKEFSERSQDHQYGGSLAAFHQGLPTTSKFFLEHGDHLKLQLASTVTMASDATCSTSTDDLASQHDYMTMLSVKAANVASQWLALLQQDLRGRLAALKRSRKRVRNALHTELPYLVSTEFSSQENESSMAHSSEAGNTVSEAHVARWKSLFVQMDRTLQEEGRHLENRLKEVQAMQLNCDKGLKHVTSEAPLPGPMAELWKQKSEEVSESEWAVQAAAASIYSTCNLVMKTENVSCF